MRGRAWVEVDSGKIVRIFRTGGAAMTSPAYDEGRVKEYPRKDAISEIRRQVWDRCKNTCEKCGKLLTWGSMQMDEKIPRSRGGEISLDNCQALCHPCHVKKHNRIVKFGYQIPLDKAN